MPYEPWNLNVALGSTATTAQDIYYVQFIAPTTGAYTKITFFGSPHVPANYDGIIYMGIYSNTFTGAPTNAGKPASLLADASQNFVSFDLTSQYVDLSFNTNLDLSANTLYWAAIGHDPSGGDQFHLVEHIDYLTAAGLVLRQAAGIGAAGLPTTATAGLSAPYIPFWFRIYNENTPFLSAPEPTYFLNQWSFGAHIPESQLIEVGKWYWLYPGFGGMYGPQSDTSGASLIQAGPGIHPPVMSSGFTSAETTGPIQGGRVSYTINNLGLTSGLGLDASGHPQGFRIRVHAYCTVDTSGIPSNTSSGFSLTATAQDSIDCNAIHWVGSPLIWTNSGVVRNGISVAISAHSNAITHTVGGSGRNLAISFPVKVAM